MPLQNAVRPALSGGALLLGLAAALLAPAACADDWGGSMALASDKVFRGVSQSEGRTALLLDLNGRTDTGWVLALGLAGPAYRTQGGTAELTAGFSKFAQLDADWTLQLGFTHYGVVGSDYSRNYAYDEFSAALGWQGRVLATLALSPDTWGANLAGGWRTDRALDFELSLHQRLAGRLALDAGIGYYDLQAVRGAGYPYGSLGLSWGLGPVQGYLTYIDSRAAARGLAPASLAGRRWVASLLWSF